jgi:hypothetical protein
MSCSTPFDAFRMATESLGDELYRRASFRNIWLNLIPRFEYPQKTGLTQSTFTIGRSEATSDTESWSAVQANPNSCNVTWNDVQVGYNEVTWAPEQFGLRGPTICQDELIYNFKSDSFLEAYLQQLTKRSERSIQNRLQNIYQHFVPKHRAHSTDAGTQYQAGSGAAPSGATINGVPVATCQLSQEMLDEVAAQLNEEGASDPNSSGWITLGDDGPVYPAAHRSTAVAGACAEQLGTPSGLPLGATHGPAQAHRRVPRHPQLPACHQPVPPALQLRGQPVRAHQYVAHD